MNLESANLDLYQFVKVVRSKQQNVCIWDFKVESVVPLLSKPMHKYKEVVVLQPVVVFTKLL
jgi:hypothetical protein